MPLCGKLSRVIKLSNCHNQRGCPLLTPTTSLWVEVLYTVVIVKQKCYTLSIFIRTKNFYSSNILRIIFWCQNVLPKYGWQRQKHGTDPTISLAGQGQRDILAGCIVALMASRERERGFMAGQLFREPWYQNISLCYQFVVVSFWCSHSVFIDDTKLSY